MTAYTLPTLQKLSSSSTDDTTFDFPSGSPDTTAPDDQHLRRNAKGGPYTGVERTTHIWRYCGAAILCVFLICIPIIVYVSTADTAKATSLAETTTQPDTFRDQNGKDFLPPLHLPTNTVLWKGSGGSSFSDATEECFHKYEIWGDGETDQNRETLNFTVWRTVGSSRARSLALVYDGRVVSMATENNGGLDLHVEPEFDEEMTKTMFQSHTRSLVMPQSLGSHKHHDTGQTFLVSISTDKQFVASNYAGIGDDSLHAWVDYEKNRKAYSTGLDINAHAIVRINPVDTTQPEGYQSSSSGVPSQVTFRMNEQVTCRQRSGVTLSYPEGAKRAFYPLAEFDKISTTDTPHRRELQSNVPVSAFLPDGLHWYQDKVQLQYTIQGIRVLGLEFYARISAALYYDGPFSAYIVIGEPSLGLEVGFSAYRSSPASGGALLTLLDEEILDIDPIPLFSIGPLTLELKPGLRLVSKLNLAASMSQIYLALRNEVHVFAEITISTPCMIVIKFKLGIKVSGRIVRIEHQFGFYSADNNVNIATALVNGDACMEVRYVQLPFSIVVEPICRVCVGFLRCRRCFSCLTGLLSSLAVYLTFGSSTTDILYTSCNDGQTFTPYPPSLPPLPSPPPSPPPPPWDLACWNQYCNDTIECLMNGGNGGDGWICSYLMPSWADQGSFGLGMCYNLACSVPPSGAPVRAPKPT